MLRPSAQCSCAVLEGQVLEGQVLEGQVLEGQVLEHVLRLGKIEVLSARARHRAPNARALLIIAHNFNRMDDVLRRICRYKTTNCQKIHNYC